MAIGGSIGVSSSPPVHVDDLVQGAHDWRNIQDVVRSTFKAFYDVMKFQGEAIRGLETAMESKAAKPEVIQRLEALEASLRRKVDRSEHEDFVRARDVQAMMARSKEEISEALLGKTVTQSQFDTWREGLEAKVEALQREGRAGTAAQTELARSQQSSLAAVDELSRTLQAKADSRDVHERLAKKADQAQVAEELSNKLDVAVFEAAEKKTRAELVDLRGDLGRTFNELATHKTDTRDTEQLAAQVSRLQASSGTVADSVEQMAGQMSRLQLQVGAGAAADAAASRARAVEQALDEALAEIRPRIEAISALKDRLGQLEAKVVSCETMRSDLARKMDSDAIQTMMGRKVDFSQMQEALSGKANAAAVEGLLDRLEEQLQQQRNRYQEELSGQLYKLRDELRSKVALTEMQEALAGKANVSAVDGLLHRLEEQLQRNRFQDDLGGQLTQLRDELRAKAAMSEIGGLLDKKANIDDVNNALAEVSNELEKKAAISGLEALMKQQDQMQSIASADGATGRWIWKSGRTKAGGAVPWNIQTVNTDPTNLQWDRDRPAIIVVVPGLYEVTFGFFSRRKPTVQLLVNGEPVLAAVNSASYVLHQSSGRLTSVGNHSSGNITGLTLIDFMALPPNAKVTLVYNGEDSGEGFLSFKKL